MTTPEETEKLLPENLADDLATAKAFMAMATGGYGHAPSDDGRRMAGFLYRNDDAIKADVMPAHAMGAIKRLVEGLNADRLATVSTILPGYALGWRTMESAPKDGTWVLALWRGGSPGVNVHGVVAFKEEHDDGPTWVENGEVVGDPDWWMPLPAAAPTPSDSPAAPEDATQRLQDHMEQHHGVCLPASAWDAAIGALATPSPDIGEVLERAATALEPFAKLGGPINGEPDRPTYVDAIGGDDAGEELQLSTYAGNGTRIEVLQADDFRRAYATLAALIPNRDMGR